MFAIHCRGSVRVPLYDRVFVSQQFRAFKNPVFVKPFSPRKSPPGVCENDPKKSFTVSYLINSCGLSSKDAVAVSGKVCFKSPEKPDAVLRLLREHGFTDAHIPKVVTRWPSVLVACPNNTLLPKIEFFHSIGFSGPAFAQKLSVHPYVFSRSLENSIIPAYNYLKNVLQSDERVVRLFLRAPWTLQRSWSKRINSNFSMFIERGLPESSIVSWVFYQPSSMMITKERLAAYVDRAVEMGFDTSKAVVIHAIQVLVGMTESTLKHKMDVYRRFGWSESDIDAAFLRYPRCMNLSEKNITATMDFLVNTMSFEPAAIAQCPVLLNFCLEERIKPRYLVFGILNRNGLVKKTAAGMGTLLRISEEKFLEKYIAKYETDIPKLLDIYRGKLSPP